MGLPYGIVVVTDPTAKRLLSEVLTEMERQSRITGDAAPPAGWFPHMASAMGTLNHLRSVTEGDCAGRRVEMLVRIAAFALHWASAILKHGHQE